MKKNEPLLADVRAPWDVPGSKWRVFLPRRFWRTIAYNLRYGWYWAPASMDSWRYRRFLGDLDEVCLRTLKSHGALTARELVDVLDRENLLPTKPERTGIHQMTVATAHAWLGFASRRGLVAVWSHPSRRMGSGSVHWELTDKGQEAVRSKFLLLAERFSRLLPTVIASGLIVVAGKWIAEHPEAWAWGLFMFVVILEIVAVNFFFNRSEKREAPGVAVVAIETLRSAKKPIPKL